MEEQVVEILQAVRTVTPEVAAQAVAYGRWCNGVWAAVGGLGVVIASLVCRWLWRHWDEGEFDAPAIFFGFMLTICSLITICATGDLIGSYIAPDYYAADAVLRMVRIP